MSLSDKSICAKPCKGKGSGIHRSMFNREDVKQFIKELKEKMKEKFALTYHDKKIIDAEFKKLAGKELCK